MNTWWRWIHLYKSEKDYIRIVSILAKTYAVCRFDLFCCCFIFSCVPFIVCFLNFYHFIINIYSACLLLCFKWCYNYDATSMSQSKNWISLILIYAGVWWKQQQIIMRRKGKNVKSGEKKGKYYFCYFSLRIFHFSIFGQTSASDWSYFYWIFFFLLNVVIFDETLMIWNEMGMLTCSIHASISNWVKLFTFLSFCGQYMSLECMQDILKVLSAYYIILVLLWLWRRDCNGWDVYLYLFWLSMEQIRCVLRFYTVKLAHSKKYFQHKVSSRIFCI